ncbi:TPA: DUF3265 domain-containing protein [Vibrio vulnificus]|nr:DUF3265 domain-containing protein [Vibrio vulnificus]HAS8484133.1 DUF3265 domain-containing protein [Vibrio vulnificus]
MYSSQSWRSCRNTSITKRLRRIHNAWRFWFKSVLVFKVQ